MKILKLFLEHWLFFITILVISFLSGFFITERFYNYYNTTYSITITSDLILPDDINADFFKNALAKYKNGKLVGYSYDSVNIDQIFAKKDIKITDNINVEIKARYFISSQGATISSDSLKRFNNVINKVARYYDENCIISKAQVDNHFSGFLSGFFSSLGGIVIYLGVFLFLISKGYIKSKSEIYDNITLFKYPFYRRYWANAWHKISKIKVLDLCLIAILFALQLCCKLITIPSGFQSLGIGITYLVFSLICMIYGPLWGLIIGFCSDVLGFFLFPSSAGYGFDFLYTIQAMLAGFTYGIFFFETDLSFAKCFFARAIINIFINAIYGSFLYAFHLMGTGSAGMITYLLTLSLPKNILYLLPQAILLYYFLKLASPVLVSHNLIDKKSISNKSLEKNK